MVSWLASEYGFRAGPLVRRCKAGLRASLRVRSMVLETTLSVVVVFLMFACADHGRSLLGVGFWTYRDIALVAIIGLC